MKDYKNVLVEVIKLDDSKDIITTSPTDKETGGEGGGF